MNLNKRTITKLALFNTALLIANVAVFSNVFFKVRIFSGSVLESAFGIAVIIMSIVLFIYVNLQIINAPAKRIDPKIADEKINSLESCHNAINRMDYTGTFTVKMGEILEQIRQMQKKQDLINDILLQKFDDSEMSYLKFKETVDSTETIMCANIKSIINRIYAFDEDEYNGLIRGKSRLNKNIAAQKMEIYKQYIDFVDQAVEDNDEILLRLDKLLLEISKFNSIDAGELENMQAMKELDNLITDTKWYR